MRAKERILMKRRTFVTTLAGFTLCHGAKAFAADIPRLVWGDLLAEDGAPEEPKSWAVAESPDGANVSILFDRLVTQADGEKEGPEIVFKRHFALSQPKSLPIQKFNADIRGHVTTIGNGSAELKVTVGNTEQIYKWESGKPTSEEVFRTFTADTVGGRLPDPFVIGATLTVRRQSKADSVLLTLDSIDIGTQ
jgi:hypothetical protein